MRISKRLRVISEFIPNNSFFLDIGCDHALLDIYTVLNKENTKAVASDINEKPLKVASANIKKYNLESKIKVKLGNGLEVYEKGIDTVIMSGLGSFTIIDILNGNREVLNNIHNLIISSNNNYSYLRKNIINLGFIIKDEKIVLDKDKYYPIILFTKGRKNYNKYELKYGPILIKSKDEVFIKYLNEEKDKLFDIYNKLSNKYILKKISIKLEIRYINKIIKSSSNK